MKKALRRVSIASRVWLAAHELCPPFSNQLIFEGNGILDVERWQRAVAIASAANPGSRLVLRGYLGASRWVDSGVTPRVREVDGSAWDGMSSEGADILYGGYSPRRGPMAEVVLDHGSPPRVIFRSHHAVMDGRGCITWAEDVFRALRGEQVLGSDDTIIEEDLLHLVEGDPISYPGRRFLAPTGRAQGTCPGVVWQRRKVIGNIPKLLPQVLILTAREVWRQGESAVRMGIPVDLRGRRPGLRSTGNLTNAIFVDIPPWKTVDDLAYDIIRRLKGQRDGSLTREEKLVPHIPLPLIRGILRREALQGHASNGYRFSGLVSNLGKLSLAPFQGGGFTSHSCTAVPVCMESFPFSMVLCGYGDTVELVLSMPRVLASGGRLEGILERIARGLRSTGEEVCFRNNISMTR
ncbi:MAG TPA: hypothetical protein PKM41_12495 [Deltaproteobacteria bacterium]|nr:hypothetical protein [Deltaproteobacteria bacterium]HOI08367.1 hypothetical protein [Deltaproteobacteria bacterium]